MIKLNVVRVGLFLRRGLLMRQQTGSLFLRAGNENSLSDTSMSAGSEHVRAHESRAHARVVTLVGVIICFR